MKTLILFFAIAAAISIFMFDKKGQSHKPIVTLIAWLYFILFSSVAIAALFDLILLRNWLLVGILSMNAIMLILKKGNVTELFAVPCQHVETKIQINHKNEKLKFDQDRSRNHA